MPTIWKPSPDGLVSSEPQSALAAAASECCLPDACDGIRIVPFGDGSRPSHALIAAAGVPTRVNGSAVVGGLRVLQHKDELMIGSQQLFFSAESAPTAEVYQHAGPRRPRCPVCRAEIQDGQSVVRCPGCSRIHHQIEATGDSPAKLCWTYSPSCRFCDHPTSMSGEPTWRPDGEVLS